MLFRSHIYERRTIKDIDKRIFEEGGTLSHVSLSFSGQLLLHCSSVLSLFANTITDHPTPRAGSSSIERRRNTPRSGVSLGSYDESMTGSNTRLL